ncbi:uncharacterized protein LOC116142371 [Pistacia vera]|uniref:uncharacterized protein LOC116142371 n=1 Tax=Pistacia vera TaxID=55513 RepID=UPI001263D2E6|nr:uncharacterized protein LOC116142371 [Pistacia vera]
MLLYALAEADQYDCVDIYKQPAFNHVLLKNHKIQMNPSSFPEFKSNSQIPLSTHSMFGGQSKGCPAGKVPIQRNKVDYEQTDLRSLSKLHLGLFGKNNIHPLTSTELGAHYATVQSTESNPNYLYTGASTIIDLQNPEVKMLQISKAQMWLEDGPPAERNSIQVGWAADASKNTTGCYNTMCPGFVQVHPIYHLGQRYPKISIRDGIQYITQPFVFKDKATGNWWLSFDNNVTIGYWPKEIFTHLDKGASFLQFGGWTYNSPDGLSPPMGSGLFPDNHYKRSCFFAQLKVMVGGGQLIDMQEADLDIFVDNTACYDVKTFGYQGGELGETFTFGGPGGNCGN